VTHKASVARPREGDNRPQLVPLLRVSAKTDYAVRAMAELAASGSLRLVKSEEIARAEGIPIRFLLNILTELRHADIVRSQRGSEGGYQLARSPADITVADIVRAVDGALDPDGEANSSRHQVWGLATETLNTLLQSLTLADLIRSDT
jgi:Rrf2 family protein